MDRRELLKALGLFGTALLPAAPALARALEKAPGVGREGRGEPFSYAGLKGMARHFAGRPWRDPAKTLPKAIRDLTWDQYQAIRYRPDHALWADREDADFRFQFFHLGLHFETPVKIHEIVDGEARPIPYRTDLFDFSDSGVDPADLPEGLGFAGFRLLHHSDWERDVAAFLGASYFRATSASRQFGLSARGLAVNTALPEPEEFPRFTHFWFERLDDADRVRVYAFLDSPSVTGAYRFTLAREQGDLIMDVDAALYPRQAIERLGVAPLTSMYQVGENSRRVAWDWRPEIHDSDGLAMHTGGGEWLWRPLVNPPRLRFNSYGDDNPRGFGLLQRDQDFDHYQDDGVFYERRPSLWVEPRGTGARARCSWWRSPPWTKPSTTSWRSGARKSRCKRDGNICSATGCPGPAGHPARPWPVAWPPAPAWAAWWGNPGSTSAGASWWTSAAARSPMASCRPWARWCR
ncbi:Glucans biosynthesis protein D [Alcanivorax sp. ALC70]|nr:Glucans biosynthesis protein D [Alcanivorax sp. ALC70]